MAEQHCTIGRTPDAADIKSIEQLRSLIKNRSWDGPKRLHAEEIDQATSALTKLLKSGIDGCEVLTRMPGLTSEERQLFLFVSRLTGDQQLDAADLPTTRRALSAVWSIKADDVRAAYVKKFLEYHYLNLPTVGEQEQARSKVQYLSKYATKWEHDLVEDPVIRSVWAASQLKELALRQRDRALLEKARGWIIESTRADLADLTPAESVQIRGTPGEKQIVHIGQVHRSPDASPPSTSVAAVAICQLAILKRLEFMKANVIVDEGCHVHRLAGQALGKEERLLQAKVRAAFGVPESVTTHALTPNQIAMLYQLGAARIYGLLYAETTNSYGSRTGIDATFLLSHYDKGKAVKENLLKSASSPKFQAALAEYGVWAAKDVSLIYQLREIQASMIAVKAARENPSAEKVVLIYGDAHNFEPAFRYVAGDKHPLHLYTWENQPWQLSLLRNANAKTRKSPKEQFSLSVGAEFLRLGDLESLPAEDARLFGLRKLVRDPGFEVLSPTEYKGYVLQTLFPIEGEKSPKAVMTGLFIDRMIANNQGAFADKRKTATPPKR